MSGLSSRGLNRSLSRSLGHSLAVNASGTAAFSPSSLFAASEKGGWYDIAPAYVWEDSAGTTPASVNGPVGRVTDRSGNSYHLLQGTTANKPLLRQSGALYYLEFDGVDDSMSAASFNLSATDKLAVSIGIRKASDAALGVVAELGQGGLVNSFLITAPESATANNYGTGLRGDNVSGLSVWRSSTYTAPITNVLFVQYDIAGADQTTEILPRVNGAIPTLGSTGQLNAGGGNLKNDTFFIGRRNNTSFPFNGRIYSMTLVGRTLTTTERNNLETHTNSKTGAY